MCTQSDLTARAARQFAGRGTFDQVAVFGAAPAWPRLAGTFISYPRGARAVENARAAPELRARARALAPRRHAHPVGRADGRSGLRRPGDGRQLCLERPFGWHSYVKLLRTPGCGRGRRSAAWQPAQRAPRVRPAQVARQPYLTPWLEAADLTRVSPPEGGRAAGILLRRSAAVFQCKVVCCVCSFVV